MKNKCEWCRDFHQDNDCRIDTRVRHALSYFAASNGNRWRRKLIDAWARGDAMSSELQQARNILGPSGLMNIKANVPAYGAR
jgi:hypothetical protein